MDRATLITTVHRRLSGYASEAGLSADEASYGIWIDYALRTLGLATVVAAVGTTINRLIDTTEAAVMIEIRSYFAVLVDTTVGPRKEAFSQVLKSIDDRIRQLGVGPMYVITDHSPPVWNEYVIQSGDRSSWPMDWWQRGYDEPTYD